MEHIKELAADSNIDLTVVAVAPALMGNLPKVCTKSVMQRCSYTLATC